MLLETEQQCSTPIFMASMQLPNWQSLLEVQAGSAEDAISPCTPYTIAQP
jgi:hypothetical protein